MPRITIDRRVIASVASIIPSLGPSLFEGTRLLVSELYLPVIWLGDVSVL
jgi:hypothetical protein